MLNCVNGTGVWQDIPDISCMLFVEPAGCRFQKGNRGIRCLGLYMCQKIPLLYHAVAVFWHFFITGESG